MIVSYVSVSGIPDLELYTLYSKHYQRMLSASELIN